MFQDILGPIKGEVYFPNLCFECDTVNFGCILNDTEATRYVNATNGSPMPVTYKWSFTYSQDDPCIIYHKPCGRVEEGQGEDVALMMRELADVRYLQPLTPCINEPGYCYNVIDDGLVCFNFKLFLLK